MPSGQDYDSRLREETRRALAEQMRVFEEEFRSLERDISRSTSRMSQRLASNRHLDMTAIDGILADAVREAIRAEVRRRDDDLLRLAHFAHDLRQKETQQEILSALLDEAGRHAPRLVLFATRGNQFVGWAARGLTEAATRKLTGCTVPFSGSELLHNALNADGLTTTNDLSREKILADLLPAGLPGPWHAFPLKAIQRPVAVLLASAAEGVSCDLEPLCVLMDLTGLCIENIALKILQEGKVAEAAVTTSHVAPQAPLRHGFAPSAVQAEGTAPAPAGASEPATEEPEVPEPQPAEAAPAHVAEPSAAMDAPESPAESGLLFEAAAPAAAVSPEPSVAAERQEMPPAGERAAEQPVTEEAAPERTEEPGSGEAPGLEPARTTVLREVQPLSEEEKLHADARRFARLLASEIKLYNEDRVREGRAKKDLYVRLKRDIDRSREMYEKRVSSVVARKADYFHDEIIRVLADNDPAMLGVEYPGPRVGA